MHHYTPREVVEILKSARDDPRGAALEEVLAVFQKRWLRFARRKWPWLAEHHEDAVNVALQRVCERIDELEDENLVDSWANLQFTRVMDSVRKSYKKQKDRTVDLSGPNDRENPGDDPFDRIPSGTRNAEEEAEFRERLRIVQSIVKLSRVAWLRLVEDLPVKEVARLTGKTPCYIRTLTSRLRRAIKEYLDGVDPEGPGRTPEEIFGKSGLPKELVAKILEVLNGMEEKP